MFARRVIRALSTRIKYRSCTPLSLDKGMDSHTRETVKEMNVQSGNGQEFLYRFYIGEERELGVYDLILICIHENRKYIYLLLAKFFRDVIENFCLNMIIFFLIL